MEDRMRCPRCSRPARTIDDRMTTAGLEIECPRCGRFRLSGVFMESGVGLTATPLFWREIRTTETVITVQETQIIDWPLFGDLPDSPYPLS